MYFLQGLNELIPDNLLSIFDENELELLMCGTGNYSVSEFKEHHIAAGSNPEFLKVIAADGWGRKPLRIRNTCYHGET